VLPKDLASIGVDAGDEAGLGGVATLLVAMEGTEGGRTVIGRLGLGSCLKRRSLGRGHDWCRIGGEAGEVETTISLGVLS